jgi:HPt (histidine-containing phosphotransfer) domain-containing protein
MQNEFTTMLNIILRIVSNFTFLVIYSRYFRARNCQNFSMETLNASVLGDLKTFMNTDEFIEFMDEAHQKLHQQAPALLGCIAEKNWGEARRLAHRLKGTLGSLGCDKLFAALHSLEEGLRQTPPLLPQAQDMAELDLIIQSTLQALQQAYALEPAATDKSISCL